MSIRLRKNIGLFCLLSLAFVLLAAVPAQAQDGQGWRPFGPDIGAYVTYNIIDDSSYGVYLMSSLSPLVPYDTIRQIAKKHKVGLIIYQDIPLAPQTCYIDSALDQLGNVVDFVTIFEEVSEEYIPQLNATYDYIKAKYPRTKVYQNPHPNRFDFAHLNQLKADGFLIGARWHWSENTPTLSGASGGDFETAFLYPALATGKPVIGDLFLGVGADWPEMHIDYNWQYAIGQYQSYTKYHVPVVIYEPFYPGFEALVAERLQVLKDSIFNINRSRR